MSEIQKIAIGLLSMSHPEIYRVRSDSAESGARTVEASTLKPTHAPRPPRGPQQTLASRALRGLKFAFAALVAGGRVVPLGDNSRLTRELGEYGAHLKGC
jgi:hypothetical protein